MAKEQRIKGALEIIEEAVFIIRRYFLNLLSVYFIGALPFVTAFLYFWTDMSKSAFAGDRIVSASLALALLFIWMKCWHVIYCRKIISYIRVQPSPLWSIKQILNLISSQAFFAGSGVIIFPLAMIITIPFGWVYAFYQNVYLADDGKRPIKAIIERAWYSARMWPGQNHIILSVISLFTIFIFLNVCIGIYLLPVILKKFFGVESVFTLSGISVLNTTFLAVSSCLTYLMVDPLIKTIYVLRSFYVFSIKSGDDLRSEITRLRMTRNLLSHFVIFALFLGLAGNTFADTGSVNQDLYSGKTEIVSPGQLDQAIERTLKQREYTWRMPRENKIDDDDPDVIDRFAFWITDKIKFISKKFKSIWDKIIEWLKKIFPDRENKAPSGNLWQNSITLILYLCIGLLICLLIFIVWRHFKGRNKFPVRVEGLAVSSSMPDLTDEFVDPVELPVDRWLNMGYEMMKKQELRLALRAFYLAVLAHLADKGIITIAKHKTNMDYVSELQRRAHEYKELLNLFSINVKVFDRSWYGMHEVTNSVLENFISDRERMVNLVHG
ncbi:MAG: DUF4129 domain-containing protein [Desulfobacteraceae bacterium]|jgi:hypothetical protein